MVSIPSRTDIAKAARTAGGAFRSAGGTVKDDVKAAGSNLYDLHVNDNAPQDIDWQKRHTLELMGAAAVGAGVDQLEDGDLDSYDVAAGTVGGAWDQVDEYVPDFRIRSPIVADGGNKGTENPSTTPEGTPTPTPTPEPTTTPTPELTYDSISAGLLEESEHTRSAFRGYSLTALDSQLEGVGLEEAVENSSDYEASIRDALEGTNYSEEGVFELGDYGRGVDLVDDIGASEEFDQYMEDLDERGELEDQMFGYVESLERV